MKIALFVHGFFPSHYHGTEVYTLMVARELAALGHEPTVVTAIYAGEPAQKQFIEEYEWDGISVISIDKNRLPNTWVRETYDQPEMRVVHEGILRRLKPDVVHVCHLLNHTTALLNAASALNLPTVATLTDFFGFCYNNILYAADGSLCTGPSSTRENCIACHLKNATASPDTPFIYRALRFRGIASPVSRILSFLSRRISRKFQVDEFRPDDLIARPGVLGAALHVYRGAVAPTQFLKKAYERNGFPAPLRVSHFGIDIDRSPKPSRRPGDPIHIGFIGQLAPHKGAHVLIDAVKMAARSNLVLTIWGATTQDPVYSQRLKDLCWGLPVKFAETFPSSDTARVLSKIDVLAIPSMWYENCPLILLQALATHTPVIASNVPGMAEFVIENRNGFLFRRGDVDSLASVFRRIADTEGLLCEMSQLTEYPRTGRDMVRDLIAAYETACAVSPAVEIGLNS